MVCATRANKRFIDRYVSMHGFLDPKNKLDAVMLDCPVKKIPCLAVRHGNYKGSCVYFSGENIFLTCRRGGYPRLIRTQSDYNFYILRI